MYIWIICPSAASAIIVSPEAVRVAARTHGCIVDHGVATPLHFGTETELRQKAVAEAALMKYYLKVSFVNGVVWR
jgi:phage baseplate assembly protein W